MTKLVAAVAFVLFASRLWTGQVQAPEATVRARPLIGSGPPQTDNGTGEIPKFYSHPRQVLVTATVWKHAARSAAWVPKEALQRYPTAAVGILATPPVARGLSANDFRIFDNGTEQKINYLEESDFSPRDINGQWSFAADVRGSWGWFNSADLALAAPTATYVIGYIPPPLQSGYCHTIRVLAGGNDVDLNRTRYCNSDEGDTARAKENKSVLGWTALPSLPNVDQSRYRASYSCSGPHVFCPS